MALPTSELLPDTAVLLVLLPLRLRDNSRAALHRLQVRLGAAVRVLPIDEASLPAVVRSFGPPRLPACVLVRQGVELWRQDGLPDDELSVCTLLAAAALSPVTFR